jgi:hypothetical protein
MMYSAAPAPVNHDCVWIMHVFVKFVVAIDEGCRACADMLAQRGREQTGGSKSNFASLHLC